MRVSKWIGMLVIGAVLASSVPASAALLFKADLDAAQEVNGSTSTAIGGATAFLNDAEDSLTILINFVGMELAEVTGAHLHAAPAGANGGVVFGFINPDSDLDGDLETSALPGGGAIASVWDGNEGNATTLADQLDALKSDGIYINIHTADNPGGAIRGQLILIPEPASIGLMAIGLLTTLVRGRRVA